VPQSRNGRDDTGILPCKLPSSRPDILSDADPEIDGDCNESQPFRGEAANDFDSISSFEKTDHPGGLGLFSVGAEPGLPP
jgi:hypothetical protein